MAYSNTDQYRSHLSMFEPTYPIQKGYIARLLLDHTVLEVTRTVKDIVQTAEPDKIINEGALKANVSYFKKLLKYKKNNLTRVWQSLIKLFQEHFRINFRRLPSLPAPSTHVIPITPTSSSVSKFPELTCTPISETQNQIDSTTTPAQMQTLQTFVASDSAPCELSPRKLKGDSTHVIPITPTSSSVSKFPELTCTPISETQNQIDSTTIPAQMQTLQTFVASDSAPCELSPRKLKGDCASCVSKQQTNLHMMQEIKELQEQLRELRETRTAGCLPPKRLNEMLKRKDDSIKLWKDKCTLLKKEYKNTQKLTESLNVSRQQREFLKRCNSELQEEKQNVIVIIEQQNTILKKLEEDYASLKCKYVKLHKESNSVKNAMHVTVKDLTNKAAQLENQVVMLTHGRDVVLQKNDENTMD